MPKIKTFADACKALKIDAKALPDVSMLPEANQEPIVALFQLSIIAQALNEGWKPDWNNSSEQKWYPWFYMNKPGFRFGGSDCVYAGTAATGGSRLCFKTEALATYAAKQFKTLYKQLLN